MATTGLRIGIARASITPPVGIELAGYAGRAPSTGIRDDLYATAAVFAYGRSRVAVVSLDLLHIGAPYAAAVARTVRERSGVPANHVLLCCTHTHYGPDTRSDDGDPRTSDVAAYLANLRYTIAGTVNMAAANATPAVAHVGRAQCLAGINRRERRPDGTIILGRNPAGPIDREMVALRVESPDGEPLACIVNFACHGTSQTNVGREISSDFVDSAREMVEVELGAPLVFLQGACGNINPSVRGSDAPVRAGRLVGAAALEAWETAEGVHATPLRFASCELELPHRQYETVEQAEQAVGDLEDQLSHHQETGAQPSMIRYLAWRLEAARTALGSASTGDPAPPIRSHLSALRLGEVAILATPGEIFTEIGRTIKDRSPLPHTLFLGYTNDSIGYVPVPEAYPEGGYEVDAASRVGPDAAPLLIQHALDLLSELAG